MSARVPLVDLRRDTRDDAALKDAFSRVLASGRYVLGEEVEAFERACRDAIGARHAPIHAIGVSSCTDALIMSLMALGIGAGDEVVCPALSFVATAEAIARVSATPVFADVTPCCATLDAEDLAKKITPRTRAVVVVHLFGQCAHMDAIERVARARDLPIVEDAAQALGATHGARNAGTMGRVACFSFFPTKNVGALGDAGLVTTGDDDLAKTLRALRMHGATSKNEHAMLGGNFRIDALQAALLRVKLARLDEITRARRANAARYDALLADVAHVRIPARCNETHAFHHYVVESSARDALRAHLDEAGVETGVYYPIPLHEQPCFTKFSRGDLPRAKRAARSLLALPIFPGLRDDEIARVASAIASFQVASTSSRIK